MSQKSDGSRSLIDFLIPIIILALIIGMIPILLNQIDRTEQNLPGALNTSEQTASYIIFEDSGFTMAKNGLTSRIDYMSTNASSVFQYAIDNTNGIIAVKPGDYEISSTINLDNDTTIEGNNVNLISMSDDLTIMSTPFVPLDKTSTHVNKVGDDRSPLTADAVIGTSSIVVVNTSFCNIGDWIVLMSEQEWRHTPNVRDGELVQVAAKTATTITLSSALMDGYQVAYNATAQVLSMEHNIDISGLNFIGQNKLANGYGLGLYRVVDAKVSDCNFLNNGLSHITVYDGERVIIDRVSCIGSQPVGYGYGVQVAAASNMVTISNSYFNDDKHGFTNGQATYGIPRHITLVNDLFDRTQEEREHAAGDFITYDNCKFQNNLISLETPNTVVENCQLLGSYINVGPQGGTIVNVSNAQILNNYISVSGVLSPINVYLADGLLIQDNNLNMLSWTSGNPAGIQMTPSSGWDNSFGVYRNIQIIGNEINSSSYGIMVNPAYLNGRTFDNILISDNHIVSTKISIRVMNGQSASINGLAIQNNIIAPTAANVQAILYIANSVVPFSTISGNTIYAQNIAVELDGYNNGTLISANTISNGYILLNSAQSTSGSKIVDNFIKTSGIGIYLTKSAQNILVEGNNIRSSTGNTTTAPIYINAGAPASNIQISGNIIYNNGQYGVRIGGANNVTMRGNTITATLRGIQLETVTDASMSGNLITATAGYYSSSCVRLVYEGVGTNGANDPASAGEWYGHGYAGLLVRWNNGATNYISAYVGGTWLDWTVT